VRYGDEGPDAADALLEAFLAPAREAGQGIHLKNLYNDYVYFWRWALWKVFETSKGAGIVSFITASSYLRGPAFIGMRQHMRQVLDELWIIDLEGDSLGPRKTENVFDIQTPVAIAVGVRYGEPQPDQPAATHYVKLTGSRGEKLAALAAITSFDDLSWLECLSGWAQPFLPRGEGDYFSWPLLTDLLPWQHSGIQFKRSWPIAAGTAVLESRWRALVAANLPRRRELFRETGYRTLTSSVSKPNEVSKLARISDLSADSLPPGYDSYAFRSFDRSWAFLDPRLADRLRPPLITARSVSQIYLTSLLTTVLGAGPAATVAASPPDLHHFRGSFGGKDVVPLWRDAEAREPNITGGLLELMGEELRRPVEPEDLFAYIYSLLASPAYADRYSEELSIPGPRVPVTRNTTLFTAGVDLGKRLLWLHTFGERCVPEGERRGRVPAGRARALIAIPSQPDRYPEDFTWDEEREVLRVGTGEIGPVDRAVWELSVSGLQIVSSWLGYRMRQPTGKRSSPLDDILPERWTTEMTEELLRLLWILEHTVELYPALAENLQAIAGGATFGAQELPHPSAAEREAPHEEPDPAEQPQPDLPLGS
jgi:hypothetical protein